MKPATLVKPMCAAHPKDDGRGINAALDEVIRHLPKPIMGSIKLDGIRCTVQNGKLYTRSLKLIPNVLLQDRWGFPELNGLDGEITVGCPWAADVFNTTTSVVMAGDRDATGAVFRTFDCLTHLEWAFETRTKMAHKLADTYSSCGIEYVEHVYLKTTKEVHDYEAKIVEKGYEGIMLSDPYGAYKQGRSTVKEGGLVAIKRFVDAEATILDIYEQNENTNDKQQNELGRSKRSHAQSGMVGKDTLGGFTVQLIGERGGKGQVFNVGTGVGLTNATRQVLWALGAKKLKGKIIKLRYQAVGTMVKPRLPIFLGFRDARDM